MYQRRLRHIASTLVVPAAFACASASAPTSPSRPVDISAAEAAIYWVEVQRRVPAWFRAEGVQPPALPSAELVYSRVRFVEVPHEYLETCEFNSQTFEIKIGDDKWNSGCVPHELGHALLKVLDHACWSNFEHPNQSPRSCD